MTKIGTASAGPGEMDTGRLPVGEGRDGSTVSLPVAVINGINNGKTLYIQAASDGDEVNGVGVVQQLVPRLDPNEISGQIIIVGIVNIYGFRTGEHRNPIDDTKINRAYPGREDGSATERIAAATFEIAEDANYILDLHQGSTSRMIEETRVRCGRRHRMHGKCLELAKVFGCGHILDKKGPDNQLARVAPDRGIPTIDPELGGSVGWNDASIKQGVEGVFNVLRYYGFLEGSVQVEKQIRATGFDQYAASSGGLVQFEVNLGDRVSKGQTIATITDVFGETKEKIGANKSGIFWRTRRLPQVAAGEYICSVGTGLDRY